MLEGIRGAAASGYIDARLAGDLLVAREVLAATQRKAAPPPGPAVTFA